MMSFYFWLGAANVWCAALAIRTEWSPWAILALAVFYFAVAWRRAK